MPPASPDFQRDGPKNGKRAVNRRGGPAFELSQLRCFVAVADNLHFTRAARCLNMTQPPLSRQIRLLEHALGTALFERGHHGVRLTPAGHVFLPNARKILSLAENAAAAIRGFAKHDGVTGFSGTELVPVRSVHEAAGE